MDQTADFAAYTDFQNAAAALFDTLLAPAAKRCDLTVAQAKLLLACADRQDGKRITVCTDTQLLDTLVEKKLIVALPQASAGQTVLTDRGGILALSFKKVQKQFFARLTDCLQEEEAKQFFLLLRKMEQNITE